MTKKPTDTNEISVTLLFGVLEGALKRGDIELAAEVRKRLRELGVRVQFEQLHPQRKPTREVRKER